MTSTSRSVCFAGPDEQLLELIERRALPAEEAPEPGFSADRVTSVSEVGVVVDDVVETARRRERVGILPYGGASSPAFAAVGDVHGLVILVPAGRLWTPAEDQTPADTPVEIVTDAGVRIELGQGMTLR